MRMKPKKLLYICFDGVSSIAKILTQRKRRGANQQDDDTLGSKDRAYRNVMSPGTIMMEILSLKLKQEIYRRINADENWTGFQVIVSDSNVAGEGDHKIVTFASKYAQFHGYQENQSHAIFSSDSDLSILALLSHEVDVIVYRKEKQGDESPEAPQVCKGDGTVPAHDATPPPSHDAQARPQTKSPYKMIEISTLRKVLMTLMKLEDRSGVAIERHIRDFVFICGLLGNDYLPKPAYDQLKLKILIDCYIKNGYKYLTEYDKVNYDNFLAFLNCVGREESRMLLNQMEKVWKKTKREKWLKERMSEAQNDGKKLPSGIRNQLERKFIREWNDNNLESKQPYPSAEKLKGKDDLQKRYYEGKKCVSNDDLARLVHAYMRSVCDYWQLSCVGSSEWKGSNCLTYAPYAEDMARFICEEDCEKQSTLGLDYERDCMKEVGGCHLEPFTQLFLILPLKSMDVLPVPYRNFRTEERIHKLFGELVVGETTGSSSEQACEITKNEMIIDQVGDEKREQACDEGNEMMIDQVGDEKRDQACDEGNEMMIDQVGDKKIEQACCEENVMITKQQGDGKSQRITDQVGVEKSRQGREKDDKIDIDSILNELKKENKLKEKLSGEECARNELTNALLFPTSDGIILGNVKFEKCGVIEGVEFKTEDKRRPPIEFSIPRMEEVEIAKWLDRLQVVGQKKTL